MNFMIWLYADSKLSRSAKDDKLLEDLERQLKGIPSQVWFNNTN